MRRLLTLIVLAVLASPLAARADGSVQLTALAGVAAPIGDIGNGEKLGDYVDWLFPVEAQLQFRLIPELSVGAYGRFAATTLPSGCPGCSATDLGFGGLAEYRFSGKLEGGPWIGAHLGYERLQVDQAVSSGKQAATLQGWELGAAAGIDYELGAVTVGPYLNFTIGEYVKESVDGAPKPIPSKGAHAFVGAGLRLSLLL